MRRLPILLLATALTVSYGWAAQSAILADLASAGRRPLPTVTVNTERVWWGGTLPPVVVEAPADGRDDIAAAPEACPVPERGAARGAAHRAPALRAI